jgi:hypothetical protein
MMTKWQTILIAAVVLPVGGFVAGSVMSSSAETPPSRTDIVVPDKQSASPTDTPTADRPTQATSGAPTSSPEDERSFQVVTPSPSSYDYDDHGGRDDHGGQDDHGRTSEGHGDDSGHGGGDDDD